MIFDTEATKKCLTCELELPLDAFYKQARGKFGRQSRCKVCHARSMGYEYGSRIAKPGIDFKTCTKCHLVKPLKDFHKRSSSKLGVKSSCKICASEANRLRNQARSTYPPEEKFCCMCQQRKSQKEFYRNNLCPDGLSLRCKTCMGILYKQYYEQKRDEKLEYQKYYTSMHKEKIAARTAQWVKQNKDLVNALGAKRRARKQNATPPWLTGDHFYQITLMYSLAHKLQENTGIKHHVDHIIPLQHELLCGLHVPWNLRVITASENASKRNRLLPELGLTAV